MQQLRTQENSNNDWLNTQQHKLQLHSPNQPCTPGQRQNGVALVHLRQSDDQRYLRVQTTQQNPILTAASDVRAGIGSNSSASSIQRESGSGKEQLVVNNGLALPFNDVTNYYDDVGQLNQVLHKELEKQRQNRTEEEEAEETDEFDEFAKKLENEKEEKSQRDKMKYQEQQQRPSEEKPSQNTLTEERESQSPPDEWRSQADVGMRYGQGSGQLEMVIQEESREDSQMEIQQDNEMGPLEVDQETKEEKSNDDTNEQIEPEGNSVDRNNYDGNMMFSQNQITQQNFEYLSFQPQQQYAQPPQQQIVNPYVDMFAEKFQKSIISAQSTDNQPLIEADTPEEKEDAEIENSMQVLIKHYLVKHNSERLASHPGGPTSFISQRILNALVFNKKNKLLSVVDAGMTDLQLNFFLETIDQVISTLDGLKSSDLAIKGLNLNGNTELSDQAVKLITDFVVKTQSVMVLSIERLKCSHQSITYLFQALPFTRIVELNVSGIPVNYFSIDALCRVIDCSHKLDLRVLHLRNTKLNDSSALKLMSQIIERKSKLKYLSMSMNTSLGFKFQQQVVQMLQKAARLHLKYNLRYLDLNFCNMSQANIQLVKKLVQYNNGELDQIESKKVRRALNSVNSSKSQKSGSRMSRESQGASKRRESTKGIKRSNTPHLARESSCENVSSQRRSQAILNTGQSLQYSLNKQNSRKKNVHKSQNLENKLQINGIYSSASQNGQLSSINKSFEELRDFQQSNQISIHNQFPNDSIQEFIIRPDSRNLCDQNHQTIQSLSYQDHRKLGESECEMAKHLKFSTSCAPNQNKSKSLSEIVDDGVSRAQPSQTLIENLNKLDLLNHINGSNDVSSSQLVAQSIQKLDLTKDLHRGYTFKEDSSQALKPKIYHRIHQMSSEGSRSRQNSQKSSKRNKQAHGRPQTDEAYGQGIQERFQMDQTFQKLSMDNQRQFIQIQDDKTMQPQPPVEAIDSMGYDEARRIIRVQEQPTEKDNQSHQPGDAYLAPPSFPNGPASQSFSHQAPIENYYQGEQLNYQHSQQQFLQGTMNEDLYPSNQGINYQTLPSHTMAPPMCAPKPSRFGQSSQQISSKPNRRTPSYQRRSGSDTRVARSQSSQQRAWQGRSKKRAVRDMQTGVPTTPHLLGRRSKDHGYSFSKSTKSLKNATAKTLLTRKSSGKAARLSSGLTLSKKRLASRLDGIQCSHPGTMSGKRYSMPFLSKNFTGEKLEPDQQFYSNIENPQNQSINLIIQEPLMNMHDQTSMLYNHNVSMNSISSNWERTDQSRTIRPPSICSSALPYSSFASRRSSANRGRGRQGAGKLINQGKKMTLAQNKLHHQNKKQQLQKSLMPKHIHVQHIDMNNRYLRAQNQRATQRGFVAEGGFINGNAGIFAQDSSMLHRADQDPRAKKGNASNNSQNSKRELAKLTTTSSFPCLDYRMPKFIDQQDQAESKIQLSGMRLPEGDTLHQINNLDLINKQRGPINSIQTTMPSSDLHSTRFRQGRHGTSQGTRNASRVSAADIKSQQMMELRSQRRVHGQGKGSKCLPMNAFHLHHLQEFITSNHNQNSSASKFQSGYQLSRQDGEHDKENHREHHLEPGVVLNCASNADGIFTGEAECLQNGTSSKNFTERTEVPPLTNRDCSAQAELQTNTQYQQHQLGGQRAPTSDYPCGAAKDINQNDRQLTEKLMAFSQSHGMSTHDSQSQGQIQTVDPRAQRLGQGPGNASSEGLVPHSQAAEIFARLNLKQIHRTNEQLNSKKLLELEAYDRDNTKSCSSKSAQISPISQTVINTRAGPEGEDMSRGLAAHPQDLKGDIKDMIQAEIQRLQALYQNIDSLLQEGRQHQTAHRDSQQPATSSGRQTLHACHSGAGFATDNTGRSQISSDITSTTPYQTQLQSESQQYLNVYSSKQNSTRYR